MRIDIPSEYLPLIELYLDAKEAVIAAGFAHEIDEQEDLTCGAVGESDFLREVAWVILSSGMRERVIRSRFASVARAFLEWQDARTIVERRDECRANALSVYKHEPKIDAILGSAEIIHRKGFGAYSREIRELGVAALCELPFIGPVTGYHLAKNIGMDTVKPDRHLVRITRAIGFGSVFALCDIIASGVGENVRVVDTVLWRFATIRGDYADFFSRARP